MSAKRKISEEDVLQGDLLKHVQRGSLQGISLFDDWFIVSTLDEIADRFEI